MSETRRKPRQKQATVIQVSEESARWHQLLRKLTEDMLSLFRYINIIILAFVVFIWLVDEVHYWVAIKSAPPARLVSSEVILALIAASTANLGLLALAIGKAVFKQLDAAPRDKDA
jgi:hypothetical protein